MRRITATLLAGLMIGSGAIAAADQAAAQDRPYDRADRDRYIGRFCDRHPGRDGCRDWRYNRGRWDDNRYRDWYRRNHRDDDRRRDAGAAALFGLGVGALLGGTLPGALSGGGGRDVTGHVQRCLARYRSYDPRTNTYLGYDGYRHECRL